MRGGRSAWAASALGLFALALVPAASADRDGDDRRATPPALEAKDVAYYSFFERWGPEDYPLDDEPRFVERGARVQCKRGETVVYRSSELRYTVRAHPAFVERLKRFEQLVIELATEHYGRAPRRLHHRGAFACRSARNRRGRISEHAFGNALDFEGLDFWRLRDGQQAPQRMPRWMRRGFRLRVLRHWSPRYSRYDYHAAFLHRLAERLRRRPDVFRGIVGPPRPRHRNHLHLDAAPWQYAMFAYDRAERD